MTSFIRLLTQRCPDCLYLEQIPKDPKGQGLVHVFMDSLNLMLFSLLILIPNEAGWGALDFSKRNRNKLTEIGVDGVGENSDLKISDFLI